MRRGEDMIDEWLLSYGVRCKVYKHCSNCSTLKGLPIGGPAGIFLIYLDLNPSSSLVVRKKNVHINN